MKYQKNLITYNKSGDYITWAKAVYDSGFNCPIDEVARILQVSVRWINSVLLKQDHMVHYVIYDNVFINELIKEGKTASRRNTYLSLEAVGGYITRYGKFEVQTEIVDLYSYLYNCDKNKAQTALKMYQNLFVEGEFGTNKGTVPYKVLDYINDNFYSTIRRRSLRFTKRNEVVWKEIKPFNIFECDFYFPKNKVRETVYRQAFLRGDIKVTIGTKKTIFIKNNKNIDNMKIPILIPYNESIVIKRK